MISFQLVSTQQSANSSSNNLQYSVQLTKKIPPICVLAPPQVKLKKTYIGSPQPPNTFSSHHRHPKQSTINHCKSNESFVVKNLVSPVKEQKNIALKFPQRRIAMSKKQQVIKGDRISQDKRSIALTQIQNAQSQFEFTRKHKKYNMPRDQSYNLTIFYPKAISPFDI